MRCETSVSSIVDLLIRYSVEKENETAFLFVDDRGETTELTFSDLDRRARAIASRLQEELNPGDRALLVYPPGLEFISAFFGCLYAGVVAVPATYPKPRRPMPRLSRIAVDCDAHVALSTLQTLTTLDPALLSADAATSSWVATDELSDELASAWQPTDITESSLAFLQYTSGSTSDPKGVMVSHGNLLTNLECIRQMFGIGDDDEDRVSSTGVFWLPAYHDMGLVGGILTPLYMGGRSVLLSPSSFLQRPLNWLEAIEEYHATISGAPNFAYEYCIRRTTAEQRRKLKLGHWRLAFCGAEPIRAETLSHFADAFRTAGFRCESLYPCYGLAETTLLAAGADYEKQPTVLAVNRAALAEHRVVPARGEPSEMVQRLVGCGAPAPGHRIEIVRPDTDTPAQPNEVGEILIQGPSVALGYWNQPEETKQLFGAKVAGRVGSFLRTGDLGFFRDGELYVTGRLKDVIIIRGRNHYPQDIEQTAEESHEALLPGAAFALAEGDDEQLVVVHQFDRQFRGADMDQIVRAIRRSIVEQHELDPQAIVLIRQTSLPITSSGKVQRNLCREQYAEGKLKVVHAWINPTSPSRAAEKPSRNSHAAASKNGRKPSLAGSNGAAKGSTKGQRNGKQTHGGRAEVDRVAERIETWLLNWLIEKLHLNAADVARDRPFAEYGVDSLTAVELSHELEEEFEVPLPPIVAWNYPTPTALARYLAAETTGTHDKNDAELGGAVNVDDQKLADLLAEVENLSDEDAARLLNGDRRQS